MTRYQRWAPYVPVAARRMKAAKEMEKMRKKGHPVSPVVITGRTIARTFWGKAWCENLESYRDFENRLPRGRTYVRNGSVVDLQISSKTVHAMVSGSSLYRVEITINALPQAVWKALCKDCSTGIDSLVELLQGRFAEGVMERLCRQDNGLFPRPKEIKFSCSCPDYAYMCKHVAAVLYGVGSRLDERPELLFVLRDVNHNDLVAHVDTALPITSKEPKSGKLLESDDVSDLFGLDMEDDTVVGAEEKRSLPAKKTKGKPLSAKVQTEHPVAAVKA
ncbi:MAG: SWIM zinc finger family protein, partial [Magnetococcales bacterium]|nr:SWIM zinc finger family protein [Magnetococcales bacterium]